MDESGQIYTAAKEMFDFGNLILPASIEAGIDGAKIVSARAFQYNSM
jgi:hypothetical protein